MDTIYVPGIYCAPISEMFFVWSLTDWQARQHVIFQKRIKKQQNEFNFQSLHNNSLMGLGGKGDITVPEMWGVEYCLK